MTIGYVPIVYTLFLFTVIVQEMNNLLFDLNPTVTSESLSTQRSTIFFKVEI